MKTEFSVILFNQEANANSLIERLNRTFRSEFLNVYLSETVKATRNHAEVWMLMYNNVRPHSVLQGHIKRLFIEIRYF